jgi:hypothetical protein
LRDIPNWAWLLLRATLAAAISTFMTWTAYKLGQGDKAWTLLAFIFSVPIIATMVSRPLVEFMHEGLGWLADHPLKAWEGNYYAFDNVHIRVFEDGDRLWFCAQDIVHACHLKALAPAIPGVEIVEKLPSLTLDGVKKFLADHPNADLGRFVLWAEREVVTPWERKRSGSLIPP